MAELQPREPFGRSADEDAGTRAFSALAGRMGLTVPHEWWASVHLLKSFEAAGFSHVQVDAPPPAVLDNARHVKKHAAAVRKALDTTGLALVLHSPAGVRLGTSAGDRAMNGLIDYAVEAGAQQIVYHALALPDEPGSEDALSFEMASLRRVVRRAELNGLIIALENLAPLYPGSEVISSNPMSLRTAARRISSEAVGICLDLGHAHISAQLKRTSLARLIEPAMDKVTLIHAHDNFGARTDVASSRALGIDPLRLDLHLPPGRGNLPWHEVAQTVLRSTAPVVLEVHPPYRPRVADLHDGTSVLFASA
ncbi:MAG: sugar phosphate isomerase/epimerase [Actinomycetota bacterium]|nr:sugar phosphate isomerase/epimerase [Actinomycetota bacterium]